MKVLLYPLIGILHVSSAAFSIFSVLPEFGVIVAGLIASVLLGIVYFLPIALIVSYFKRFKVSERFIHVLGLVWLSSVVSLVIAEVCKVPFIMMVSTGAFVLLTIATTTLTSLRLISKQVMY